MKGIWKKCLGLTAGLLTATSQAADSDVARVVARTSAPVIARSHCPVEPAVSPPSLSGAVTIEAPIVTPQEPAGSSSCRVERGPISFVYLGRSGPGAQQQPARPVRLQRPVMIDPQVQPVAFQDTTRATFRGIGAEPIPMPATGRYP